MSDLPPASPESRPRRYGRNIALAICVGLLINVLLGLFVDFERFKEALAHARPWEVALPFAAILLVYLVDSLRYLLVFRQLGVRLTFSDAFYNNVIGYFFCNITPSSAGGQPFQVLHFRRLGIDTTVSTNVIFSRLLVASLSQLLIVVTFLPRGIALLSASGNGAWILGTGMLTTAGFTGLVLLICLRPTILGRFAVWIEGTALGRLIARISGREAWAEGINSWSESLQGSLRFLWSEKRLVLLVDFLLYILDQVIWAFGLYFPFVALTGARLPFGDFLFAFIVCGLVSAYIPTPGASGSVEAAYALVLGGMTASFGSALSAVFLWRLGTYYLHLVFGGLVWILFPWGRRRGSSKP